jgi:hypothetical protein
LVKTILDSVFEQNQHKLVQDHQCEEMVHALKVYGKVAMERFIDCFPMICWNLLQNYSKSLEEKFLSISDHDLEVFMVDTNEFKVKFEELGLEAKELKAGLDELNSFL